MVKEAGHSRVRYWRKSLHWWNSPVEKCPFLREKRWKKSSHNLTFAFLTMSAFLLNSHLWNMSVINPEGAEAPCMEDGLLRRRPSSRTGKHAEYHYWHNFEVRERERGSQKVEEDLKGGRPWVHWDRKHFLVMGLGYDKAIKSPSKVFFTSFGIWLPHRFGHFVL